MCNPVQDGEVASQRYPIDLPTQIAAEHRSFVTQKTRSSTSTQSLEDFYIGIPHGYIDNVHLNVVIPDPSTAYIMDINPSRHRHLERVDVSSIGTYTALVLRIIDRNGRNPYHSAEAITKAVFDPDGISAHSQYRNCSWGEFTIVPPANGIGVIDVEVDADASDGEDRKMTQLAEQEALKILDIDNLFDYTDFILYVTPPMGSWIAYASVGGGYSVYNSVWGGYLSSLVHEIG